MSKIRDKKTGKIIEVPREQLSQYGISTPTPQPTTQPQQQKSGLKEKAGMIGSILGGLGLGPIGAFTGGTMGKRIEQGRSPLPVPPATVMALKYLDPKSYEEIKQHENPEQDIEALKYGATQGIMDYLGGKFGEKIIKPIANKVLGPLRKVGLKFPKGVQSQANTLNKEVNDEITKLLTDAQNKGGSIKTTSILQKLNTIKEKYTESGANVPEAVKVIDKLINRFSKTALDEEGNLMKYFPLEKDLISSNTLRQYTGGEVWGATGRELKKTGAGRVSHAALKQTGGDLRNQLTKEIENTIGKGTKLDKLFEESGIYSNLAKSMDNPLQPDMSIGTLGLILGSMGLTGSGGLPIATTGLGLYGASKVPYTNFVGKKAIGGSLDKLASGSPIIAKLLADYLQGQQDNAQLPNENIPLR